MFDFLIVSVLQFFCPLISRNMLNVIYESKDFSIFGSFFSRFCMFSFCLVAIGFIHPLTSDCKFSILGKGRRKGDLGSCYFVALLRYTFFIDWDTFLACLLWIYLADFVIINGCIPQFGLGRLHSFNVSSVVSSYTQFGSPLSFPSKF